MAGAGARITSQSGTAFARHGGYTLASGFVGYRINRQLSAQLNVSNLFDKLYDEKIREYGPATATARRARGP